MSGDQKSVMLEEIKEDFKNQNYQLKPHMKEGDHFMLVDKNVHSYWAVKYGKVNQIQRFGIKDESGEQVVEIYLKPFNLYPIPNKKLFKFPVNE